MSVLGPYGPDYPPDWPTAEQVRKSRIVIACGCAAFWIAVGAFVAWWWA